ncbi:MAG: YceI family protein [Ilumatobacteraceae bacterium]|nr:YceI family protein [Ilumatobacteraceae bacterium]MCU1389252.1 YceI family protein [Ilumatobacteraceae bacterium]
MSDQINSKPKKKMKLWLKIVIGVVLAGIIGATAGPFIYIHFIKSDAPKSAEQQGLPTRSSDTATTIATNTIATTTIATTAVSTPGTTAATTTPSTATAASTPAPSVGAENYKLTMSSDVTANYVGYRVTENLFGQDTEGVGRTTAVTGSLTLDGSAISAAEFTVDMTKLKSDEDNRDRKFQNEIMETSTYPTATFTITQPIDLGTVPADGTEITATATGNLTLHGVTKPVTLTVKAQRNGDIIDVLGSTNVKFADYAIANPSNGAVTTADNGTIEFLLSFTKA